MIIHRIIQPEFNGENRFVGFTNIIMYDLNHVMDPHIEHDDIYNLWREMHPLFRSATGQPMQELGEGENIGLRIPENALDHFQLIINEANLTENAPRELGDFLAVIANYHMIPHGNFAILDARIYIHATTTD